MLKRSLIATAVALSLGLAVWVTDSLAADGAAVTFDIDAPPAKTLSGYNFFVGRGADQIPNEGVIPYDLNTPLFSDYSSKHRFVWMPEGVSATYDDHTVFDFPVGTVLIKTFGYLHDMRDPSKGERIIETRLLVHKEDGWVGLPYIWNEEGTEATLKVAGGTADVEWIHSDGSVRTNNYIIPNMNQCKSCHVTADDTLQPIGPKARHINKDYAYESGAENQLTHWAKAGYLTGVPDPAEAPRLAVYNDPSTGTVNERARAYLDINCMHCHNPDQGGADTTGLDLTYNQTDPTKLGIMKPPVAAGRGAGDLLWDIVPGKPEESILLYRLDSTDPGIMMPELPRRLIDEEGVALIEEWIAQLNEDATTGD